MIAKKVRKQHTAGLANVEEGRLADKLKPKVKTRQRKRPVLGSAYKNIKAPSTSTIRASQNSSSKYITGLFFLK